MNLLDIKKALQQEPYNFIKENKFLSENIILLGLGGSHAYGTETDDSDVDIRGIATNSKRYILTGRDFEQFVDIPTDTTIYSFDKMVKLLCSCNPNVIEILGLKPEHYLYLSDAGRQLLENKKMFLSQKAASAFGGYANSQLRRLGNKAARTADQEHYEANILKSIQYASDDFKERYFKYSDDAVKLYLDNSFKDTFSSEIFMDITLQHYPLRDFTGLINEMRNIVSSYEKISKRNRKAASHNKLGKHMMHLVRLYLMCFDILENEEIITHRENEHSLLMSIRNGEFLGGDNMPTQEFYELLSSLEKRFDYAKQNTGLPQNVDSDKVFDFVMSINNNVCSNKKEYQDD